MRYVAHSVAESGLAVRSRRRALETRERDLKIAAFTMVYNDAVFLPIWLRYYGQAFGEENLFVLDHGSDDGSIHNVGHTHVLRVPRSKYYDEDQRAIFVSRCQAALLSYYDVVVFTDADEFLIPDPAKFSSLPEFIERRCKRFINAIGLELYHLPDVEEDIDLTQPILSQRSFVRFAASYCKPLISKIPLRWQPGFHACNYPPSIDQDLFMFHLKRMDKNMALRRLQMTRAISWSKNAHIKGHGTHHRLEDQQFVTKMFPYSAENIKSGLIEGFDFSRDLAQLPMDRANSYSDYEGSVALIPERFRDLIKGATPHAAMDGAAARRPMQRAGIKAGRVLKRLIAVNTIRDLCRPLAEYFQNWFTPRGRG
jgi:hypothetical protein